MFVAIVGTRCSGKNTVAKFLVKNGFQSVGLHKSAERILHSSKSSTFREGVTSAPGFPANRYPSPPVPDGTASVASNVPCLSLSSLPSHLPRMFSSPCELLLHVTQNWRSNFVTVDLTTKNLIQDVSKRPFFVLITVDAPLLDRFKRLQASSPTPLTLEDFVRENDNIMYCPQPYHPESEDGRSLSAIYALVDLVKVHIVNSFESVKELYSHLEATDLLNPARLRPSWDDYFMTLASLASKRSNCMKRRVGAILVREKRIVATGYNGTPRGVENCNEGGCAHCNDASKALECVCLHAEENALFEAGRERVGDGAVLYCNTCPCLRCTIKIIQAGVREVVYNLSYKVDDASARLFGEAGVQLRRHSPQMSFV